MVDGRAARRGAHAARPAADLGGARRRRRGGRRRRRARASPARARRSASPRWCATSRPTRRGSRRAARAARSGLGSGWVLDGDAGLVVTAAHVVNRGERFFVTADGRESEATVVGAAPCDDLAVLRAESAVGREALALAGGDAEQGESVLAFGFPETATPGEPASSTRGVVSAARTSFRDPAADVPAYSDAIRTDTALDPGFSGGPLVDLDGRVAGVNAAARRDRRRRPAAAGRQLRRRRRPGAARARRPAPRALARLDRRGLRLPDARATSRRAGSRPGLWVQSVVPGTGADRAGLAGEYVVAVDGRPMDGTLSGWCRAADADPLPAPPPRSRSPRRASPGARPACASASLPRAHGLARRRDRGRRHRRLRARRLPRRGGRVRGRVRARRGRRRARRAATPASSSTRWTPSCCRCTPRRSATTATLAAHGFALPDEPNGLMILAADEAALAEELRELQRGFPELEAEALAPGEPAALEPAVAPALAGVRLHTGHAVPPAGATAAFAARAEAAGARLRARRGRGARARRAAGRRRRTCRPAPSSSPPGRGRPRSSIRPARGGRSRRCGASTSRSGWPTRRATRSRRRASTGSSPSAASRRRCSASSPRSGVSSLGSTFLPDEPDAGGARAAAARARRALRARARGHADHVGAGLRPPAVGGRPAAAGPRARPRRRLRRRGPRALGDLAGAGLGPDRRGPRAGPGGRRPGRLRPARRF